MIARRWHGRVPAAKAEEYLRLSEEVGLADYRSTEGNCGAWCLYRREGGVVHIEMFTLWDDLDAIRRFEGEELTERNITTSTPISSSSSNPRSPTSKCSTPKWARRRS